MKRIAGKTIREWQEDTPLLGDVIQLNEVFWSNPKYQSFAEGAESIAPDGRGIQEAEERLERFAPYIATAFPETREKDGIIESPLVRASNMKQSLEHQFQQKIDGELFVKCDSHLAVSGSIKARGGIYEVLKHAEELAMEHRLITKQDDYRLFASETFKNFFSAYSIVVGSTGNLGLSIGIMGAKLGFHVTVHMSADAQQWKKDLLREKGVTVVEHTSDYEKAVEEGRKQSETDPNSYFVDDENSMDLFLGYATAAARLKTQLEEMNRQVDMEHPLFVYLPCGVGGAPGGVAFGLKTIFQDHVHCIFAEPTHSPSMLIGLLTGKHDDVSVYDFGIDNETVADGLAVGRPSRFVGKKMEPLLSGSFTVEDQILFKLLRNLADTEDLWLEPSALAGVYGPVQMFRTKQGQQFMKDHNVTGKMEQATHIAWATGGCMVPKDIMARYYEKGRS